MKIRNLLLEIFDSLFVMLLCFGTLLTAMLLKSNTLELEYAIHIGTFTLVILGLGACLAFILNRSEKGLRNMVSQLYKDKEVDL